MIRIAIPGGPCAGKTTVFEELKRNFADNAVFVPEIATLLLSGGFPAPPQEKHLGDERFNIWCRQFQKAIYHTQVAIDELADVEGEIEGKLLRIGERGTPDGAGYHPEGLDGLMAMSGKTLEELYADYDIVIFLESLAVGQPDLFSKANNQHRYESVENAIIINQRLYDIYKDHPNFHFIDSRLGLREKVRGVNRIVHLAARQRCEVLQR